MRPCVRSCEWQALFILKALQCLRLYCAKQAVDSSSMAPTLRSASVPYNRLRSRILKDAGINAAGMVNV